MISNPEASARGPVWTGGGAGAVATIRVFRKSIGGSLTSPTLRRSLLIRSERMLSLKILLLMLIMFSHLPFRVVGCESI
jgi:hypothetical protein